MSFCRPAFLLIPFYFAFFSLVSGQSVADYTVQVSAITSPNPAQIMLHWPPDANATSITIYRKTKNALAWGPSYAILAAQDTSWTDTAVAAGDAWEYRISKNAGSYGGTGYIFAGIEVMPVEYRGKVLFVLDTTYKAGLSTEIARMEEDLWGDGWQVQLIEVDRNDTVPDVRAQIQAAYNADPVNVKSVFLFGHVPVPYSGNINPDGHTNHKGAWPADVYYGEVTSTWGDVFINNTSASRAANRNIPGDGKFDQSSIPSDVELQVGRVDFANMSTFSESEEELLRRYLDKDHAWRHKEFTSSPKAVIDDNFGVFGGEVFASSGWRNFGPLVGAGNVAAGDFRTELNSGDHLWAYGCGGGSYTSANGIGNTANFASDSLRGVFTMIFGSYHGDWDSNNNFMRAALASKGTVLSCAWAGRPAWHFHHMGQGNPIGYSARLSQNYNSSLYFSNYFPRYVHIALMGDPTLRMHIVAPADSLVIQAINGGIDHALSWTNSADSVAGYYIYRQDTAGGRFWPIHNDLVTGNTFTDSCITAGDYQYMVRALMLQNGSSGSYWNLSQGLMGEITSGNNFAVTTSPLSGTNFCPGDAISVPYTVSPNFCAGNQMNAELSDASGNFSTAVVIGNQAGSGSGSISAIIPANTQAGNAYRVRVIADNPSIIGSDNGTNLSVLALPQAAFSFSLNGDTLNTTNTSQNGSSYFWDFGDGNTSTSQNPTHAYSSSGAYTVMLISSNSCGADTVTQSINTVAIAEAITEWLHLAPNPAQTEFRIWGELPMSGTAKVRIRDAQGRELLSFQIDGAFQKQISTLDWPAGLYSVLVEADGFRKVLRLMVLH